MVSQMFPVQGAKLVLADGTEIEFTGTGTFYLYDTEVKGDKSGDKPEKVTVLEAHMKVENDN